MSEAKPTAGDLWRMVEDLAAEVESRLPTDDGHAADPLYPVARRIQHREQVTMMHTAFWSIFGGMK